MAKTKELRFSVSLTVNLGNYESAKIEVGESIDLEPKDDVEKEMNRMIKRVKRIAAEEESNYRNKEVDNGEQKKKRSK